MSRPATYDTQLYPHQADVPTVRWFLLTESGTFILHKAALYDATKTTRKDNPELCSEHR
jgi:hypothetical protein